MRPHKNSGVDAHDGQSIQNKTECSEQSKTCLMFMYMSKDQILTNESWCNGETRYAETGEDKDQCKQWMFETESVKSVEINVVAF